MARGLRPHAPLHLFENVPGETTSQRVVCGWHGPSRTSKDLLSRCLGGRMDDRSLLKELCESD